MYKVNLISVPNEFFEILHLFLCKDSFACLIWRWISDCRGTLPGEWKEYQESCLSDEGKLQQRAAVENWKAPWRERTNGLTRKRSRETAQLVVEQGHKAFKNCWWYLCASTTSTISFHKRLYFPFWNGNVYQIHGIDFFHTLHTNHYYFYNIPTFFINIY